MAVTNIPNVQNWTVTPQNGQAGYFGLMNTWLGQSTLVIASLQTAIVAQNKANSEINVLAIQTENNAIIATGLANFKGAWSGATTYSKGQSVESTTGSKIYYTSKVDNNLNRALTDTNYWLYNPINDKMALTGNQTVAGVKTFSSSPIVPAPTNGGQVANKDYADLKVALADFTGANVNKSANGYQKLPNGLILQWGSTLSNAVGYSDFTYPIAFPNSVLTIIPISFVGSGSARFTVTVDNAISNNQYARVSCWNGDNLSSLAGQVGVNWLVIGY